MQIAARWPYGRILHRGVGPPAVVAAEPGSSVSDQLDMFAEAKPRREKQRMVRHPHTWDEVAIEPNSELMRMVRKRLGLEVEP